MSRITILFCVISIMCISFDVSSEENKNDNREILLKRTERNETDRPKAPSRVILECYYSSGHLRFTMPADAEYLYIIIGDEDVPVWTGMVTGEYPETDIPVLIGEYEITCRTDGNQIFGGTLAF